MWFWGESSDTNYFPTGSCFILTLSFFLKLVTDSLNFFIFFFSSKTTLSQHLSRAFKGSMGILKEWNKMVWQGDFG